MGGRFVFPHGHRIRIANFVSQVKLQLDASVKAPKKTKSIEKTKATQSTTKSDSDTDTESIASISKHVRKSIASWIEKQGSKNLQHLKENTHFTVSVSYVPKSKNLGVCVRCLACRSRIQLQRSVSKTSTFAISNWTRHVKKCLLLHIDPAQSRSLLMYLSPPVSSQESSTDLSSDHVVKQVSKQDPIAVEMAQTPIFYEEELASLEQNLKPPLSSSFGATPSPKKVVADQPSFSLIEKSAFWPLDTTAYPRNEVANQPGFLSEESAALGPILPNASLNPTCTQSSAAKPGNEPANHPGF